MANPEAPTIAFDNSPHEPYIFSNQSKDDILKSVETNLKETGAQWLFWSVEESPASFNLSVKLSNAVITFGSQLTLGANGDYYHLQTEANLDDVNKPNLIKLLNQASQGLSMGLRYFYKSEGGNRSSWNVAIGPDAPRIEL